MSTQTETIGPNTQLEEAEILLQQVRHRIGADDPDVTARDLEEAESSLRFARTRLDAARELEQERAKQAQKERIEAIRSSLPKVFDATDVDTARAKLEAALEAYCATAKALDDRVSVVWLEVAGLGPGTGMTAQSGSGEIIGRGTTYRKPSVHTEIGRLARETLRRHFPHTPIQLDRV